MSEKDVMQPKKASEEILLSVKDEKGDFIKVPSTINGLIANNDATDVVELIQTEVDYIDRLNAGLDFEIDDLVILGINGIEDPEAFKANIIKSIENISLSMNAIHTLTQKVLPFTYSKLFKKLTIASTMLDSISL